MLGLLGKAGLTSATMGSGGGTVLAKPAKDVMLLDIYRAVEEPGILALHANAPNPVCEVGKGITAVLGGVIGRAEHAMEAVLADVSVLDMVRGIKGTKHSR
jgi:DNA-binding IscR family transcriptional regulator